MRAAPRHSSFAGTPWPFWPGCSDCGIGFAATYETGAEIRSLWTGGNLSKNRSPCRRSCSHWRRRTWTMPTAKCVTWRRRCLRTSNGCSRFWSTRAYSRPTIPRNRPCGRRCSGGRSASATAAGTAKSPLLACSPSPRVAKGSSATYWTTSLMPYAAIVVRRLHLLCSRNGPDHLNCYDPASQSVTGTLSAYGYGPFALNSTGSQFYYLNQQSSTLAATVPPPQPNVLGAAATGQLDSAAYDAINNLLLAADTANNIEVLDAGTFEPAGHLFVPGLNYTNPYMAASGGSGFVTFVGPVSATQGCDCAQVLRFDPVSLQVTGAVTLLNNPNDNLIGYSQPVMSGSTLYVPLTSSQNGGPFRFAGSAGAPSTGVPNSAIAVVDTLQMKLVALWPFQALPLLGLAPGHGVAYAVFPAGNYMLDLDEIDLSTGKITLQVQIPGSAGFYSNPAVSPDGSTIYVTSNNTLYTFNAQTLAITHTVTGIGLTSLTVSPDGNYLYGGTPVPCQDCSEQIVSTSSLKVIGTIPVSTAYPEPALFLGN